ncbi:hypothetical protein ACQR0Z_05790 [Bradyrhizobium sp. HKCCYLS3077]|uniref:hypothetical protein n=1 Tax=Bradyrhizobium sp. HKCCYLS3077 TaxID=3420761 RepID=UPI003EC0B412
MDTTLALVIGAVILALVIFAFLMRKRFSHGRIKFGKFVEGEVKGDVAGATVVDNRARGKGNKIVAQGAAATAARNDVEGEGNEISAKTN